MATAEAGLSAFASALGRPEVVRSLVDMDEHLDDAARDFRNLHLAQLAEKGGRGGAQPE
jgi:hypothetical protein